MGTRPRIKAVGAYNYCEEARVRGARVIVRYTKSARAALQKRTRPLIVEMQIYFSCMVQKRVLFHDDYEHDMTAVNDKIAVALRVVESQVCDPHYYAEKHPVRRELLSDGARKMKARELLIDFKNNNWSGEFEIAC